jgi:hypothetical protein
VGEDQALFYWLPAPGVGNPCPCDSEQREENIGAFSAALILIHTLPTYLKGQPLRLQPQGEHPRFSSPTGEPQQLEPRFILVQLSFLCEDLQRCCHKWGEELSPRERLENICESTTLVNEQN